jgi:hypothetical protein
VCPELCHPQSPTLTASSLEQRAPSFPSALLPLHPLNLRLSKRNISVCTSRRTSTPPARPKHFSNPRSKFSSARNSEKRIPSARLLLVMAEPTQLAFRTLKGIGILNTAPVYEPLPGFVRYVLATYLLCMYILTDVGLRETSDVAATRPTANSSPGPRLKSRSHFTYTTRCMSALTRVTGSRS